VSKLLDFVLGSNHGIIYRRAELKELIAMHSSLQSHGGDLKSDTVTIIGATLDLQEKVVRQAMTPIDNVFMLSIDANLDYATLQKVVDTGHSRVPVYEEVAIPDSLRNEYVDGKLAPATVKRIIGILLVKQCVLLDPKGMFYFYSSMSLVIVDGYSTL
jgi:metal transporter CNNM